MTVTIQKIAPADIEKESFKIIESEMGEHRFDRATFQVIRRVIHTTADFTFAENIRISPGAIEAGIAAIRAGKRILTDVTMVASGISKGLLADFGGEVICRVADPEVALMAKKENRTRAAMAISMFLDAEIGIVAMGNAPTALIRAIEITKEMPGPKPLLIGVPVGFVNAAESKDLLVEENDCYITSLGRKGGSPVAAAIVNALIRMAAE
ncbi:MAG: precorrin-8X methylmutase [Deltaproteobacteria bacterium]|nr:MAG: precorrin-8X methylmutase [Desulfobacterales bacterium]PIE73814.1 MAG: precorrin-8X methylmutase [Deltaproteobacteria bacterium]